MAEQNYRTLFSGELDISYSGFDIEADDPDDSVSIDSFTGQENGLCGAAKPGRLFFTARPKDCVIRLDVNLHSSRPDIDSTFSEIVEVSFQRGEEPVFLCQWGHEEIYPLDIPPGDYRIRYCIDGLEKDYEYNEDDEDEDEDMIPIPGQHYLIEMWPQEHKSDQIIKQSTKEAAYWHGAHGNKR